MDLTRVFCSINRKILRLTLIRIQLKTLFTMIMTNKTRTATKLTVLPSNKHLSYQIPAEIVCNTVAKILRFSKVMIMSPNLSKLVQEDQYFQYVVQK